jgi:hypothetical protein
MAHQQRSTTFIASFLIVAFFLGTLPTLQAQPAFDMEAYKRFLTENRSLTAEGLLTSYPPGTFAGNVKGGSFQGALFADSIDHYYSLTGQEKDLIDQHGFMVTERLTYQNFGHAYLEIYYKDLPVFVSTDAILHALHMSYDAVLMDLERHLLINRLDSLLTALHGQLPALAARYGSDPRMAPMLRDLDIYLTIPRILLTGDTTILPAFPSSAGDIATLRALVAEEVPGGHPLFGEMVRTIDFSQFKPRGHYTQDPRLSRYFQAMIWLGRSELQLLAPEGVTPTPGKEDIRRQTIDGALLVEAAEGCGAFEILGSIDVVIRTLVGESDNVTLPHMRSLVGEIGLTSATALFDDATLDQFQSTLKQKAFAFQRINSQILMDDPFNPENMKPASALMLLGQRFVLDSYVTGELVHDKVPYRMLPSTLDILFALGNNATGEFLQDGLKEHGYAPNLAALRYLVDSYDDGFWGETFYNGWLNAIRTLNPPDDRSGLPPFMRTAAWWQEKMNTQLASWAQLRHDNLLYAKQSYSGGVSCSFPKSLVEPIPEFYKAVGTFADNAATKIDALDLGSNQGFRQRITEYFQEMKRTMEKLHAIAVKELSHTPLTSEEELFLRMMLYEQPSGCTTEMTGWYPKLFYEGEAGLIKHDLVVADVHTAPTDESGNEVGWVLHGGTGDLNMAVVLCGVPGGKQVAYIGPVMSYYEHLSTGYKRLTDEEWVTTHKQAPTFRPAFVNLYLAGKDGGSRGETISLTTGVEKEAGPGNGSAIELALNYPNPFSTHTLIGFTIPPSRGNTSADLTVYDANGAPVRALLQETLPAGSYSIRWDGTDAAGAEVASGVYFCTLRIGGESRTVKMTFLGRESR